MAAPTPPSAHFEPDRSGDDPQFQSPCDECYQLTYDHCASCGKRLCIDCSYSEELGNSMCMACYTAAVGHLPYEHRIISYRVPIVRPHEALSLLHFLAAYEGDLVAAAQAEAQAALEVSHQLTRESRVRD